MSSFLYFWTQFFSKSTIFFHNDTLGSNSKSSNREQAGSDGVGGWALSANLLSLYIVPTYLTTWVMCNPSSPDRTLYSVTLRETPVQLRDLEE